ncbi:hypothetical protein [Tenacibaculum amylolyticum]|uniref:hypothetical protein n=1 Tax=Tenacibaculum amylolyticum TaxID=104269 RepID=UPI003894EF18
MEAFKLIFTVFLYAVSALCNTEDVTEVHEHSYTKEIAVSTINTVLEKSVVKEYNTVSKQQIIENNITNIKQ